LLKDFYHLKRDNNPHREDAFTLSCLGKLHPASSADFLRCRVYLSGLLDDALSYRPVADQPVSDRSLADQPSHGIALDHESLCCGADSDDKSRDEILIIGLTESGIIPSLLMYIETLRRNLNTHIIYSTRRPLSGIAFTEKHSHGPDHILPLPDCKIREIWIVEDEITSGNTVYNLMIQLCDYLNISRVRIFAFADFRDSQQKSEFSLKTALKSIECTVHTLNNIQNFTGYNPDITGSSVNTTKCHTHNSHSLHKSILKNSISHNKTKELNYCESSLLTKGQISAIERQISEIERLKSWHLPHNRPALAMKSGDFLGSDMWELPSEISRGIILTIGESVDMAACFAIANENLLFQQISLSPWKVDNRSIFSRISFAGKYYLYNYEKLKNSALHPVFILCDPIDKAIEQEAIIKLGECGIDVKPIF